MLLSYNISYSFCFFQLTEIRATVSTLFKNEKGEVFDIVCCKDFRCHYYAPSFLELKADVSYNEIRVLVSSDAMEHEGLHLRLASENPAIRANCLALIQTIRMHGPVRHYTIEDSIKAVFFLRGEFQDEVKDLSYKIQHLVRNGIAAFKCEVQRD